MTINWGLLQFGFFLAAFFALIAAERLWPRRALSVELVSRWSANMGFTVANTVTAFLAHFVIPTALVAQALYAETHGYGVLHLAAAPWWIAVPVSIAALDLTLYGYHVACHKIALLWRFHRVHHLDLDVDATTAFRAHPFEYLSSQMLKLAAIYALGAPAIAVLAYELMLNFFAMFSHSNVRLSERADRILRLFIVTPDMHRVHHSTYRPETDSNYGVVTPMWDRLFATYLGETRAPQATMRLGLDEVRGREAHNLVWLLAVPAMPLDFSRGPAKAQGVEPIAVTTSLRTEP